MKFIKVILKILLTISLTLITISFAFENMVNRTIAKDVLSKKMSGYILDNIIDEFNIDELGKIENEIRNNKYVEEITSKYANIYINNILNNENEKVDITEEINSLLEDTLKDKISENQKQEISNYLQEQNIKIQEKADAFVEEVKEYDDYYTPILNVYDFLINFSFRICLLVALFIDIILLIILEKLDVFKSLQIAVSVTLIISLIILSIINYFSTFIEQQIAGGWINLNMDLLVKFIAIELVIDIIIFIIRELVNKRKPKNELE